MSWSRTDYFFRVLNVLGAIAISCALFLHEDEEGRFQNRVEEWWKTLSNKQNASRSRAATFMREVARLAGQGFDRLFGKRLLSLRLAACSVCFSIASLGLFAFLAVTFGRNPKGISASPAFLFFLVYGALGLAPAFIWDGFLNKLLWASAVVIGLWPLPQILFILYRVRGMVYAGRGAIYVLIALGVSFACDIAYLMITRWVLRRISTSEHVYEILLAIVGNLLVLVILLCPIYLGVKVIRYSAPTGLVFIISVFLNSIDFAVGFSALILAVLLLLHRLFWAVAERPVYSVKRFVPLGNKRLLWRVGIALIFLPTRTGLEWLHSLLEKL